MLLIFCSFFFAFWESEALSLDAADLLSLESPSVIGIFGVPGFDGDR